MRVGHGRGCLAIEIEAGVGKAGVIGAGRGRIAGHEERQEIFGVGVIGEPGFAEHHRLALGHALTVHARRHNFHGNVDAELCPIVLQGCAQVRVLRRGEQGDPIGPTATAGKPGLRQQVLGRRERFADRQGVQATHQNRRCEAVGRHHSATLEVGGEGLAVERKGEGAAHAGVEEGRRRIRRQSGIDVHADVIRLEVGRGDHPKVVGVGGVEVPVWKEKILHVGRVKAAHKVVFARFQTSSLGASIPDKVNVHSLQMRQRCARFIPLPVRLIAVKNEGHILFPPSEFERPRTDGVTAKVRTVMFDCLLREDTGVGRAQEARKGRERLGEVKGNGALVEDRDATIGAGGVKGVEDPTARRGDVGVAEAFEAVPNVFGNHGAAGCEAGHVGHRWEADIAPQRESVHRA